MFASGCALVLRSPGHGAGGRSTAASLPDGGSRAALIIGGAEAMAAGIALQDLVRAETAVTEDAGWLASDGGVSEADPDAGRTQFDVDTARCSMTPSNYEARVELDAGSRRWHVVVLPAAACMRDMYGGGAIYEIDADSFEIRHRELSE